MTARSTRRAAAVCVLSMAIAQLLSNVAHQIPQFRAAGSGAASSATCSGSAPSTSPACTWRKAARRLGFELTTVQQWMLEQVLGIEPAVEDEKPKPRRTQADKWAINLTAATQFYQREGTCRCPRRDDHRQH
ncbi:hypothetical protein [Streptomyces sp. NPDC002889]|uniref:hypothetical protein n=1 Tax=Streptomyces sp. NPDC002889 TaxID=3364669 RepID=UPI003685603F